MLKMSMNQTTQLTKTMTRTIPTDKKGNIYYGTQTAKEAIEHADTLDAKATLAYVAELREHGFSGVANRVLSHCGGRKELEKLAGE